MVDASDTSASIHDARGRRVTLLDPALLHALQRHNVIDADTLDRIVNDLEPGQAAHYRRMWIVIPAFVAAVALGFAVLYYFSDAAARRDLVATLINPAIMPPVVLCCIIAPWFVMRRTRLASAGYVLLKHRRCPHCGYDLRGLPPESGDHATVCPECGCAWRMDAAALEARRPGNTLRRLHFKTSPTHWPAGVFVGLLTAGLLGVGALAILRI